ncbi:MAG: hypothetical protein MRY74_06995 [Neomegalonema sp.]|nr:hypothetical protein [Neomegalonema sp.]
MADAVTTSTAAKAATASTATSTSTTSTTSTSSTSITDAALADYDDFLTLLTTQLKNQDPLNPQDGAEFVEQIATFTTVEQQVNANERLDKLIAATVSKSVGDLAGWVGMEVSAPGLAYAFDGSTSLSVDGLVDSSAESAKMVIKDSSGAAVAEISYDPKSEGKVTWDGTKSDGSKADAGNYFVEFQVSKKGDDGELSTSSYTSADFSKVVEARMIDDKPSLILANGYVVTSDQVTAVRTPG